MTILIATEFGIRELEGEELDAYLAAKAVSEAEALQQLTTEMRNYRNELLMRCDWIELPSAAARLSAEKITSWLAYREALRDITTQAGFPSEIQWPTQPE
jgi:hypothetical protein